MKRMEISLFHVRDEQSREHSQGTVMKSPEYEDKTDDAVGQRWDPGAIRRRVLQGSPFMPSSVCPGGLINQEKIILR